MTSDKKSRQQAELEQRKLLIKEVTDTVLACASKGEWRQLRYHAPSEDDTYERCFWLTPGGEMLEMTAEKEHGLFWLEKRASFFLG